jgi:hypothetical protein
VTDAATAWVEDASRDGWGEYLTEIDGESWRDYFPSHAEQFWRHYEVITGQAVADHSASFFSCSC